jgi:alpha-ketoglutarate-dependent taurine dioxygenase
VTARRPLPRFSPGPITAVCVSAGELVRESVFDPGKGGVMAIEPREPGLDLAGWAAANRDSLLAKLDQTGAILFRNWNVDSPTAFGAVATTLAGELLDYIDRAAPRHEVAPRVFTSTEFTADQRINMHHEMSYSHNWPERLYFYCDLPPEHGGRTPLASERIVFPRIDPAIRDRFAEKKIMYVRNYGTDVDIPWNVAFQTDDPHEVEDHCRAGATEVTWLPGGRLRTRHVGEAIVRHPRTGERVWFNHAHLFHFSSLERTVRDTLLEQFGVDGLPRNALYGDGTPIEDSILDEIRGLYEESSFTFPWQRGDVLLVDNFLMTHGREPYRGARRILVAMSDLHHQRPTIGMTS